MITDSKFIFHEYCVTGMFKIYGNTLEQDDAIRFADVSLIYIAATFVISVLSIKKRDVV